MSKEKETWKRPQDIKTFRTNDPKEMFEKYLPKPVFRTWNENFVDEDTGKNVMIERRELVCSKGIIDQEKLQLISFALQAGEIQDVEVCNEDISEMKLDQSNYLTAYMVDLYLGLGDRQSFACYAQNIPQAIKIATDFGNVYRGFEGYIKTEKVAMINADLVPDNHQCIPAEEQKPAYERKDYFRVRTYTTYWEGMSLKHYTHDYIVAANEVGEAKERISRLLDYLKAMALKNGDFTVGEGERTTIIQKAAPFKVDCCVPKEFSDLYHEQYDLA